MPRTFDGTDDKITLSLGSVLDAGSDITLAAIASKSGATGSKAIITLGVSSAARVELRIGASEQLAIRNDNTIVNAPTIKHLGTDGWVLVAITKPAGTTSPRFYKYVYSTNTWTRETSGSTLINPTARTTSHVIGAALTTGFYAGDILCVGALTDRVLTDAEIDRLPFSLAAWLELFSAGGFWALDQAATSMKVPDLSGNGASESAIVGTAVSTVSVPSISYGADPIAEIAVISAQQFFAELTASVGTSALVPRSISASRASSVASAAAKAAEALAVRAAQAAGGVLLSRDSGAARSASVGETASVPKDVGASRSASVGETAELPRSIGATRSASAAGGVSLRHDIATTLGAAANGLATALKTIATPRVASTGAGVALRRDTGATRRAATAASYRELILRDNPSFYLRLGEPSGTTAEAEVGPDGTYIGSPARGVAGALANDPDTSVTFGPGYVSVPLDSSHNEIGSTFTLEFWARFPTNPSGSSRRITDHYNGSGGFRVVYTGTTRNLTFTVQITSALSVNDGFLADDSWHHYAYVVVPDHIYLYRDGALLADVAITDPAADSDLNLGIGASGAGASLVINVGLDEYAIYKRALTAAEIEAHYEMGSVRKLSRSIAATRSTTASTVPAITRTIATARSLTAAAGAALTKDSGLPKSAPAAAGALGLTRVVGAVRSASVGTIATLPARAIAATRAAIAAAGTAVQTGASVQRAALHSMSTAIDAALAARVGVSGYHDAVLADDPSFYHRFDESSGTTAVSEIGPDGTYTSVSLGHQGGLVNDTNTAAQFGPSSRVDFPDAGAVDLGDEFTIEFLVNFDDPQTTTMLDKGSIAYKVVVERQEDGNAIISLLKGSTEVAKTDPIPVLLDDDTWAYVAIARVGLTSVTIYVNGVARSLAVHDPFVEFLNSASGLRVADGLLGRMDELALYWHALSPARIAEHYAHARSRLLAKNVSTTRSHTVSTTPLLSRAIAVVRSTSAAAIAALLRDVAHALSSSASSAAGLDLDVGAVRSAVSTATATLAGAFAYIRTLLAEATAVATLPRSIGATRSAAAAATDGTLSRSVGATRMATAGSSPLLMRAIDAIRTAAISAEAALTRSLAVSRVASTGVDVTVARAVAKILGLPTAATAVLAPALGAARTATVEALATLPRSIAVSRSATAGTTATRTGEISTTKTAGSTALATVSTLGTRVRSATVTATATLSRSLSVVRTVQIGPVATIAGLTAAIRRATTVVTATLSIFQPGTALVASVGAGADTVTAVSKRLNAQVVSAPSVRRALAHLLTTSAGADAVLRKLKPLTLSAASSVSAALQFVQIEGGIVISRSAFALRVLATSVLARTAVALGLRARGIEATTELIKPTSSSTLVTLGVDAESERVMGPSD